MATVSTTLNGSASRRKERMTVAYLGLLLFITIYFVRPNELIPGTIMFPYARIAALAALGGLVFSVLSDKPGSFRMPRELILLLLLFGHLGLTIPFAVWRGGSFQIVFHEFTKVVLIFTVITAAVTSLGRLRKLLFIQGASVGVFALMSSLGYGATVKSEQIRLGAVVTGLMGNPNDFAWALAMSFPICFAFMLRTRNPFRKSVWLAAMGLMTYALLQTYSRGGLIAMVMTVAVCLWEFGVVARRRALVLLICVAGLAILVLAAPEGYLARMTTIMDIDQDKTVSAQYRRLLFWQSVDYTIANPVFGLGPGNFMVVNGTWHATHNTFTELSSEAGLPALILFLLLFRRAFQCLRTAQGLTQGQAEFDLLRGALRACLVGFLVGGLFGSVAYQFYPYFLVAYSCALSRIAEQANPAVPRSNGGAKGSASRLSLNSRRENSRS